MKSKTKKKATKARASKRSALRRTDARQEERIEGPRPTPISTLSRQALNQGPDVARNTDEAKSNTTLSGDLTEIPRTGMSSAETVPELIAEGQDLEAEYYQALEDAPAPDRLTIKIRPKPPNKVHAFKDRNKI
jgi:hypothetical protein